VARRYCPVPLLIDIGLRTSAVPEASEGKPAAADQERADHGRPGVPPVIIMH
jgi:hypothetical protein